MTTEQNRRLVEHIFAGLAAGDARPLVDAMAEDFSWTVTGATPWSGVYAGKAAVLGELFTALTARIDGPVRTIADRILADGDQVVVEAHGDNRTREGVTYNNRYCFVFSLEGGRLKAVAEYLDTELATAALSAPAQA